MIHALSSHSALDARGCFAIPLSSEMSALPNGDITLRTTQLTCIHGSVWISAGGKRRLSESLGPVQAQQKDGLFPQPQTLAVSEVG